jgi:hypothetical protein
LWHLDAPSESNGESIIARPWCLRIGFVQEFIGHASVAITLYTFSDVLLCMDDYLAKAVALPAAAS